MACGAEPVVYVERGAFAASVLVARMADACLGEAPVWDDVATFDARAWRGVVDLVAGGSPCQDLSVAGKRAGLDGLRSGLWRHQLRVLEEAGAPFLFWENVGGAVRAALDLVTHDVGELGYRTAACTLRAADVGAPHERERLFVLAYSEREALRLESESIARRGGAPVAPGPLGELVHTDGHRPRGEWLESEGGGIEGAPRRNADRRGGALLGDPNESDGDGGQRRTRRRSPRGAAASGAGSSMADASSERRPQGGAESAAGWGAGVGEPQRALADPERGGRLEVAAVPRGGRAVVEDRSLRPGGGHQFPPGRDPALWRDWNGPQPGVRRGVDGSAASLEFAADRLELLGNGVVPQQAAAAFLICWQRLFRG